jgi:hypothetical protein
MDGSEATFTTPIINGSEVPALMGLQSMVASRCLVDPYNRKLMMVGPGGYTIDLSPGSRVFDLEQVQSGHLLLPVSEWQSKGTSSTAKRVSFYTGGDNNEADSGLVGPMSQMKL